MKKVITKELMEKYNILEFDNLLDIFKWIYADEYNSKDLAKLMKKDTMQELVVNHNNVRIFNNKFYYSAEMNLIEKELKKYVEEQ